MARITHSLNTNYKTLCVGTLPRREKVKGKLLGEGTGEPSFEGRKEKDSRQREEHVSVRRTCGKINLARPGQVDSVGRALGWGWGEVGRQNSYRPHYQVKDSGLKNHGKPLKRAATPFHPCFRKALAGRKRGQAGFL